MPEGDVLQRRDHGHANQPREAGQVLGQHRVALVRHGAGALLAGREELFRLQHFGPLHVADLDGDVLDAGRDHTESREEHRVAGARGDLGGNRVGGQLVRLDRRFARFDGAVFGHHSARLLQRQNGIAAAEHIFGQGARFHLSAQSGAGALPVGFLGLQL